MTRTTVEPRLRALGPTDRARVEAMTRASGVFHEDEVLVAMEVFDAAVAWAGRDARPTNSAGADLISGAGVPARAEPDYTAIGADFEDQLAGWICWGPTPCTRGTYDLYWLVVDAAAQRAGVGTALVREMERRLAAVARLIVVETAGRDAYRGTRAFYEARGYRPAATIPDFYAPGDDQVVYIKTLTTPAR